MMRSRPQHDHKPSVKLSSPESVTRLACKPSSGLPPQLSSNHIWSASKRHSRLTIMNACCNILEVSCCDQVDFRGPVSWWFFLDSTKASILIDTRGNPKFRRQWSSNEAFKRRFEIIWVRDYHLICYPTAFVVPPKNRNDWLFHDSVAIRFNLRGLVR